MAPQIVTGFVDMPEYLCASSLKVRLQYCLAEQRRKHIPMFRAKNMIRRGACGATRGKTFAE